MSEPINLDALAWRVEAVMGLVDDQAVIPARLVAPLIAAHRVALEVVVAVREANENHLLREALPAVYDALAQYEDATRG